MAASVRLSRRNSGLDLAVYSKVEVLRDVSTVLDGRLCICGWVSALKSSPIK